MGLAHQRERRRMNLVCHVDDEWIDTSHNGVRWQGDGCDMAADMARWLWSVEATKDADVAHVWLPWRTE